MIRLKSIALSTSMTVVAVLGFAGGAIDSSAPGWATLQQVEASPYRRSVRRTSRRTSRRVSRRHSHYGGGYGYRGGAAVVGAAVVGAVAVGTMVATLPPACSQISVDGVLYQNCDGTYYVPSGSQYVVVQAP